MVLHLKTEAVYAGAWWNDLQRHVGKFRLWPTSRLLDLIERIEGNKNPLHAGYVELIHAGD